MSDLLQGPDALFILLMVALLAHEPFRWVGLRLARGLATDSEVFVWVRLVATALVAGLVTRLVLFPAGALGDVPLAVRVVAFFAGLLIYAATRRLGVAVFTSGAMLSVAAYLLR